jgi:hypothetical protein
MLDDGGYGQVLEMLESDIVTNIIGSVFDSNAAVATQTEEASEPEPAKQPTITPPKISAKKAPVAEPVAEKPKAAEMDFNVNLDGLSFDD